MSFHEHFLRRRRTKELADEKAGAATVQAEGAAVEQPAPAAVEIDPNEARERIIDALRTVFDPEIPVNIYELGLIYDVEVESSGAVSIKMTLTSPHCPVAESLPLEVERVARGVRGITAATVDIVWDPAWNPDMMSEAAKLELGMF